MALNEEIQEYVRKAYVNPARQRGETEVRIKAGDVHRSLHWSNRVPSVCTTLASQKFQRETGLKLISRDGPPSGYGTRAVFTYSFASAGPVADRTEVKKPTLETLYGILANVFQELGGGEKYLNNERKRLHFRDAPHKDKK
ncbi:MAG TPA: hypothetical protein VME86_06635 [Acidobacteriaceae bacterium]|nr:hypothetical protein [Acidobacteriaceae bacterium]